MRLQPNTTLLVGVVICCTRVWSAWTRIEVTIVTFGLDGTHPWKWVRKSRHCHHHPFGFNNGVLTYNTGMRVNLPLQRKATNTGNRLATAATKNVPLMKQFRYPFTHVDYSLLHNLENRRTVTKRKKETTVARQQHIFGEVIKVTKEMSIAWSICGIDTLEVRNRLLCISGSNGTICELNRPFDNKRNVGNITNQPLGEP